ncbi:MAG: 50S ribosomal protein L17 [Brevinematales bacterium]|nr:50S ribosomal protein L17 [Brevinematales bacterium]
MRHGDKVKKLGRYKEHRKSMLRNLSNSLIKNERIITTVARAKYLKRVIEKIITRSKEDTLHNRRIVFAFLRDGDSVNKLFSNIGVRYKDRNGGYTRIVKLGKFRKGDGAELAVIEFV